ncbi:MAG: IS630 family transposase [Bacteriovoracales bacterium]|nr:IS630 family transposase [Bacteriovoracales bacterium]
MSDEDRKKLNQFIRSGPKGHENVRAITLLFRDKGQTRVETAATLDLTPQTVTNTCQNYDNFGLERTLKDDPRPGPPLKFHERVKAKIVALVCSDPPEGFDRWTLELIREESIEKDIVDSISKEKIRIILKEFYLKPWQQKMWCIPRVDKEYIERMEKILDLYEKGDTKEKPLICLDEKMLQLSEDSREATLIAPGEVKKMDYEYRRNGTANVFFALEPFGGHYTAKVTDRRTKKDFAIFLKELSKKYDSAQSISLVMDNLNTHNKSSLEETFGREEGEKIWKRFKIYYTPKHASWLNMAEIAIGMYSRQCLGRTRIPDMKTLKRKTESWERYVNEKGLTINWTFTKNIAREKMDYG